MKTTVTIAIMLSVVSPPLALHAASIASDSFATSAGGNDYVPFISILGQGPTVGATGFLGPWQDSPTDTMVAMTPAGLTHDLTPGPTFAGHLVAFGSDGTVGAGNARNLSRTINYTPTTGTYYMSVLLHKFAPQLYADFFVGLGRLQDPRTSVYDVEGTWIGWLDGAINFAVGPNITLTQLLSTAETSVNETYFALLQYDFTTSGPDTVTTTIYDSSSTQVASRSFPGLNLDQIMGRFSVLTQHFGPVLAVDEWRFGTELSDVMVRPTNGDFDFDGDVDGRDFLVWQRNPGLGSLADWQANYGSSVAVSANGAMVPEPASVLLLLAGLAVAGLCGPFRRNQTQQLACR